MGKQPKTHSEVLWHFTGGPTWNCKKKRQNTKPKSNKEASRILESIINSNELRVGSYHEVIKCRIPIKKNKKVISHKSVEIPTSSVCCVADIPTSELFHHSKRYGKCAIGFKRNSLVKAGFNPVFYTIDNRNIVRNYYYAGFLLENLDNGVLGEVEQLADITNNIEHDDLYGIDVEGIGGSIEEIMCSSSEALDMLKDAMAYIKTFSENEFDTIYAEREWRSIKKFTFKVSDIAGVILPKSGGHYNAFEKKYSSIRLYAWEDLSDVA